MARVEAICVSEAKGTKKTPLPEAVLREAHGIEGDCHAGPWHRQVSLLAVEDVETMRASGLPDLSAGDFAENLSVSGLDLLSLGLGTRLRVGDEAELSITQHGKVCHSRCAIYQQAGDCIMPRRGIFARVVRGGTIVPGAAIEVLSLVPRETYQAVVLTISDRCSQGEAEDTAGPAVAALLEARLGAHLYAREVLPDEQDQIEARFRHYSTGHGIDLVVAVGGTGFAPRDVTPEAVRAVAERLTPGLDEAMRAASLAVTPHAVLSRCASGIAAQTLILSLPGSRKAAVENLSAVLRALPHGLDKLRGDTTPCA